MNATGLLIVALGIAVILCVLFLIAQDKQKARRKRDVDESAADCPYFGSDVAPNFAYRDKDREVPKRRSESGQGAADGFRFAPELFEHRSAVIEELEAQGFSWLSHYSSVDCLHDQYGLEVCGIHERDDAKSILEILKRMFPDWKPG